MSVVTKILIPCLEQKVKGHFENNFKVNEGHGTYQTQYYNLIKFIVTKLPQYMIFVTCKCYHLVSFYHSVSHDTAIDTLVSKHLHQWFRLILFSCFSINETSSNSTLFHHSKTLSNNHVIFFIQTRTEMSDNENWR